MSRGWLCHHDGQYYVVVSTDSLAELLPTSWALVATPEQGPLQPPLVLALRADAAGEHPGLWIRTTQIRTVHTASLTPCGPLPPRLMAVVDELLPRLLGLPSAT